MWNINEINFMKNWNNEMSQDEMNEEYYEMELITKVEQVNDNLLLNTITAWRIGEWMNLLRWRWVDSNVGLAKMPSRVNTRNKISFREKLSELGFSLTIFWEKEYHPDERSGDSTGSRTENTLKRLIWVEDWAGELKFALL
jgi:hypothetical protein